MTTKAYELAERRDLLNEEARNYIERANDHNSRRDLLNGEIRELKTKRDALNSIAVETGKTLANAKDCWRGEDEESVSDLKRKLRALEATHMTSVLDTNSERKLIRQMKGLQAKMAKKMVVLEQEEASKVYVEHDESRRRANLLHQTIEEKAEQARQEHEEMIRLYDKAHETRKEADAAHKAFRELVQTEERPSEVRMNEDE